MKLERRLGKLLVEPAAVATGDIAFNLIVFFLVCASTQPDSGRRQDLPSSEKVKQEQKTENILVALSASDKIVTVNGDQVKTPEFPFRLARLLQGTTRPEDRVVVVRSDPNTPYLHWIAITTLIQDAGASITIQREEERTIAVGD